MSCAFIEELSKLRKLSMESVENTASFAPFKRYLHVVRPVEEELRTLLRRVNHENKKCLVLLCGSAGDGKSHIMSYLRHADLEGLLGSFKLYNDATESSAPELTSIDALYEKLAPFNDENYQIDDGFKMILAINLGTLNNFIESDKGQAFTQLKKYVEDNESFSSYTRQDVYIKDSVFQHISFADYQVFTLKEDGVVSSRSCIQGRALQTLASAGRPGAHRGQRFAPKCAANLAETDARLQTQDANTACGANDRRRYAILSFWIKGTSPCKAADAKRHPSALRPSDKECRRRRSYWKTSSGIYRAKSGHGNWQILPQSARSSCSP